MFAVRPRSAALFGLALPALLAAVGLLLFCYPRRPRVDPDWTPRRLCAEVQKAGLDYEAKETGPRGAWCLRVPGDDTPWGLSSPRNDPPPSGRKRSSHRRNPSASSSKSQVLSVCTGTSRLLLPPAIVARLRFSDLHRTSTANTLEVFDEKSLCRTTLLKPVPEGSPL